MAWTIRHATAEDAAAISRVVVQTVQESNAKDYPQTIIAQVIQSFSPERVAARMSDRQVFVALDEGALVGTGSLEGTKVRSVFVVPSQQGRGIGRALMGHIEHFAKAQGISRLEVPASITAEGFYRTIGYKAIRDEYYGDERTIVMGKTL